MAKGYTTFRRRLDPRTNCLEVIAVAAPQRMEVRRSGESGTGGCSIGEICDLHDLASGVIGGPFADLFSALEVA